MGVSEWLHALGLGRYAAVFVDNEIDEEVLPDLTEDDLVQLGLPLGPRKKILKAIAALRASSGGGPLGGSDVGLHVPGATLQAPLPAAAREQRPEAERRQLTVMFVDLVGSTQLSSRMDPEDLGALIRVYQNTVAGEIARFEGHVAKYMGDGVLAYFGWPKAHEDESERAVRAGLAIVNAVGRLSSSPGEALECRVGIATGQVVVGDLFGPVDGEAVVGDTPNLAARLQSIAKPDQVVISETTRRLIGGLFEIADLGARRLKGFSKPIDAYSVLGEGKVEGRFEALHGHKLAPLVGREHELGMLRERFERARDGEGQVVILSGEAGIGKSRLLKALREEIAEHDFVPVSHFCSPYHTNSAFHPIVDLLARAAGIGRTDSGAEKLEKLEAMLRLGSQQLDKVTPLVASLMEIPFEERYPPLDLTPQRQRELTLEVLVEQVAGLAQERPVLVVYEDVQWVDPTTLDAISMLLSRVQQLPVLVLITCRPDFSVPWQGHAHVMQLSLTRLTRSHGEAIVRRVTKGKTLPDQVLDAILTRSDGVPLFVEELAKAVLEAGDLRETAEGYELNGPLMPMAVPSSLHDSLMSRLDRLAPVREVAQIASVIGRDFSQHLLSQVSNISDEQLGDAIAQLLEAELILQHGVSPQATYSFKHALVQDAAYQSLLKSRRQQIHGRIAAALSADTSHTPEPEILARHFSEAGLAADAIGHWREAGQRALARSAITEAIAHLSKALEFIEALDDGPDRQRLELGLQLALASAFVAAQGIAAPAVGQAYTRAQTLCDDLGDLPQWFAIRYGQCIYHLYRAELTDARLCAEGLLEAADPDDVDLRFYALRASGVAALPRGDFVLARDRLRQALDLYDPNRHVAPSFVYAFDPQVVCLDYLARTELALGRTDEAMRCHDKALEEARKRRHHNTIALPLFFGAMIYQLIGDRDGLRERVVELMDLTESQSLRLWAAGADVLNGWLIATDGERTEGVAAMEEGIASWQSTGARSFVPYFRRLTADVLAEAGDVEGALKIMQSVLQDTETTGERWMAAENLRVVGELLCLSGLVEEGERQLNDALNLSRRQGAALWEARAAASLEKYGVSAA